MRPPDRIIGDQYLERWHLIPRNPFFNVMLHRFVGSDDERALHCHPWCSVSFLLKGTLFEIFQDSVPGVHGARRVRRFWPVLRRARFTHRLILVDGPAWTIVFTGPVIRAWGFQCPNGWVHHKDFTDATGNGIGRGCD